MRILSVVVLILAFALASTGAESTDVTVTPGEATLEKNSSACTFKVSLSSGRALALDFTGSGIDSLTDDRGTDLGSKQAGKRPDYKTQPAYVQAMAVDEGKGLSVTALSPQRSGSGARSLILAGALRLKVGLDARQGRLRNVALSKGTQMILGGYEARVTDVRRTEKSTEFTLEFSGAPAGLHVHDARLEDADGKQVPARYDVTSSGSGDKVSYSLQFKEIGRALEKASISYLLISDSRMVNVPFKITVPVKGSGLEAVPVVVRTGTGKAGDKTSPKNESRTAGLPPVGKYGIKIAPVQSVNTPCHVGLDKPLKVASGERYLISLVPASRPDSYWGWWKELKNGATGAVLNAPDETGSYELRLGRARAPEKTYSVLQRVKVLVK